MDSIRRFSIKLFFGLNSFVGWLFLCITVWFLLYYNTLFSFWKELSNLFAFIADNDKRFIWATIAITIINESIPIILISYCGYYFFAKKYFELYKVIKTQNKYVKIFFETSLDEKLNILSKRINRIEDGIEMTQDEVNVLQSKVMRAIKTKNSKFFITSLLEPDEIANDSNHMKTILNTIEDACNKKADLERIIFTSDFDNLLNDAGNTNAAIHKIARLHVEKRYKLYIADKNLLKNIMYRHDIDGEYLDFMLIDGQVIYGLKNDNNFKTIITSNKYILYIKHSKKELRNYRAFIEEIKTLEHCRLLQVGAA